MKSLFLEAIKKLTKKEISYMKQNKNWLYWTTEKQCKSLRKTEKLSLIKSKLKIKEVKVLIDFFRAQANHHKQNPEHIKNRVKARAKNKLIKKLTTELNKQIKKEQAAGIKTVRTFSTRLKMKIKKKLTQQE